MDPTIITWIWFAVGLLLVAAELFVPGLVLVFGGVAAIAVGILRAIGLIESLPVSFVAWMVTSILLVLSLRKTLMKVAPSEEHVGDIDEHTRAYGKIVDVVETVQEDADGGRIRYQGTTWKARSLRGTIESGQKARLSFLNNLEWQVEPVDAADLPSLPAKGETGDQVPAALSTSEKSDGEI